MDGKSEVTLSRQWIGNIHRLEAGVVVDSVSRHDGDLVIVEESIGWEWHIISISRALLRLCMACIKHRRKYHFSIDSITNTTLIHVFTVVYYQPS